MDASHSPNKATTCSVSYILDISDEKKADHVACG